MKLLISGEEDTKYVHGTSDSKGSIQVHKYKDLMLFELPYDILVLLSFR